MASIRLYKSPTRSYLLSLVSYSLYVFFNKWFSFLVKIYISLLIFIYLYLLISWSADIDLRNFLSNYWVLMENGSDNPGSVSTNTGTGGASNPEPQGNNKPPFNNDHGASSSGVKRKHHEINSYDEEKEQQRLRNKHEIRIINKELKALTVQDDTNRAAIQQSSAALDANHRAIDNRLSRMSHIQRPDVIYLTEADRSEVYGLRRNVTYAKREFSTAVRILRENADTHSKVTCLGHNEITHEVNTHNMISRIFRRNHIYFGDAYTELETRTNELSAKNIELTARHLNNINKGKTINENITKKLASTNNLCDTSGEESDSSDF